MSEKKGIRLYDSIVLLVAIASCVAAWLVVPASLNPLRTNFGNTPSSSLTVAPDVPFYSSPVQDVRVRRAIAYCTDRYALAKAAYSNLTSSQVDELIVDSFLPKTHWAYVSPGQNQSNLAAGQAVLEDAGWTFANGGIYRVDSQGKVLSLTLTTGSADYRRAWVAAFQTQMQACGIQLQANHVEASWWFGDTTGLARKDFEVGAFCWPVEENPDINDIYGCEMITSEENNWYGSNFMGWCNQRASEAARQASDISLSQSERLEFFTIVQQEFAQDVPSLPLFLHEEILQGVSTCWEHIDFNLGN